MQSDIWDQKSQSVRPNLPYTLQCETPCMFDQITIYLYLKWSFTFVQLILNDPVVNQGRSLATGQCIRMIFFEML